MTQEHKKTSNPTQPTPTQTPTHTDLEVEAGLAEQGEGAVGEGELALVEVLALLRVLEDNRVGRGEDLAVVEHLGAQLLLGRAVDALPVLLLEPVGVAEVFGAAHDVLRGLAVLLHHGGDLLHRPLLEHQLLVVVVQDGLERALRHLAGLGLGDVLGAVAHQREDLRHGDAELLGVVHQAADVVEDDAGLALHLRHLGTEAAADDGHDHGQRGRLHVLHEDAGGQVLDGLRRVVGVLERLHQARDDRVQVRVAVHLHQVLQRGDGGVAVVCRVG